MMSWIASVYECRLCTTLTWTHRVWFCMVCEQPAVDGRSGAAVTNRVFKLHWPSPLRLPTLHSGSSLAFFTYWGYLLSARGCSIFGTSALQSPTLHSDNQTFTCFTMTDDIGLREIFEHAHLKFTVSGLSKQASKHTHACAQWSHASVGLAQARPNNCTEVVKLL